MGQLATNALEVQCQSCGAKSLFVPPEVAGRCEFCGVQIVAQPKSADPIMAPEGLLPFSVSQKQAGEGLRECPAQRDLNQQPRRRHGLPLYAKTCPG